MKVNARLEVMKVFDDLGEFSHWAINLHIAPLPSDLEARALAEKLMKRANQAMAFDQPFPEHLDRPQ
jgi:hypothetical protein